VVVETLVEALRDLRRFDPRRASLSAWLFGLARRRVLQEIRRQRRRKSIPPWAQVPLESMHEERAQGGLAEGVANRLEAQRAVAALRPLLSDVEMEALVLSAVAELTVAEIAHTLGRSGRAVHSILHRARSKARERLARDV
jgi:RNA polymerase sigma-70 factor (ECF subfamily)